MQDSTRLSVLVFASGVFQESPGCEMRQELYMQTYLKDRWHCITGYAQKLSFRTTHEICWIVFGPILLAAVFLVHGLSLLGEAVAN